MTSLAVSSTSTSSSAATVAASTTATSSTDSVGSAASASTLTQSDFLQLLTAQLKYQTPTDPADPTQLASEFAAISEVSGINQLNTTASAIESSGTAGQIGQAAGLVGKQVAVSGDTITPDSSGNASAVFNLANSAQSTTVNILSPSGTVAATLNLGALSAGQQSFTWDGGTPGTQYTYSVDAVNSSGAAVTATPYTVYTVQGVNVSGTTQTLSVEGSATAIPVSSVQTVLGASS